uniref:USP domain-containing protein n=1 Tax=Arion vulgaris TaxID=1028688 RepID=A0A0B7AWB8_9EUPU
MTVEQTPLPLRPGQRPREENLNLTIAKIREVTGAPDHVIKEAIQACMRTDGTLKVEDVVTTIIGDDTLSDANNTKKVQQTNIKALDSVDSQPGSSSTSSPYSGAQKKSPASAPGIQTTDTEEYIDLTRDTQGILGGQISREEQDISRVLEASLADSKGSTKRKRGELWFIDPLNPHERRRQEGWPVGLKNVGNTCWFSAVIQSLFHIHKFKDIVLNYKTRPLLENETGHNLRFVSELRQLFALMVGSERKYVDPSKSVNILKEASSTTVQDGQQQDVSEFQHKLLEWLEDAFNVPPSLSGQESRENPVHQLFQGKYKAEGFHEGKVFSQEVTFGQYPLNVVGFRDIHESLEATTAQGEIETISGDSSQKSGQEIWFTHLPVVLTFELSRFGFNQRLNRAEKIHQQLMFPPVIYLDRYLECNKSITRQKREEARKLKDELSSLQARLDKFMNYGSSSKRYPLPDVLQYALDFAESSPSHEPLTTPSTLHQSVDVEMESPVPCPRVAQHIPMTHTIEYDSITPSDETIPAPSSRTSATTPTTPPITATSNPLITADSANSSSSSLATPTKDRNTQNKLQQSSPMLSSSVPEPKKFKDSSVQVEFNAALMPTSMTLLPSNTPQSHFLSSTSHLTSTHSQPCPSSSPDLHRPTSSLDPHPRSVTTEELKVLQDCLQRWREEVEADVRELQKNIAGLVGKLDRMYSDDYMKKFPYDLHAVLVHEGQAVSGHYWAFIYDANRAKWLKFNDITVSESSLEEMHKESVGGYHNASAYCLMYVDRSRLDLGQGDSGAGSDTSLNLLESLPSDLQQVVEDDNAVFRQEIFSWDEEQRRKSTAATSPPEQQASSAATTVAASTVTPSASVTSPHVLSQWRASAENQWSEGQVRERAGSDDQDVVCTGEQRPGETSIIRPMNPNYSRLACDHAQLSLQTTLSAVTGITQNHNVSLKPQDIATKAIESEILRLRGLSRTLHTKLPSEDPRLGHIVLYLICSHADNNTTRVILFEQFSLCVLLDSVCMLKDVRYNSHEIYKQLYNRLGPEGIKCYEFWHKRYNHFRQAIFMFTEGADAYCRDRFQEALPYFNQAWLHNREPGVPVNSVAATGISPQMLAYFRRISLQKLNELTLKSFECDLDMTDALTVMTHQIIPSLAHISASEIKEDVAVVEEVRGRWCQFLEKDLNEEKIERLQDFLSKMFEGGGGHTEEKPKHIRLTNCTTTLHDKYIGVMRKLKERGELNVWTEAS